MVFSFPEPMDYMNLGQRSYVLVKVAHEVFNIMEIIELPAFRNEWIAKTDQLTGLRQQPGKPCGL